MAPSASSSGEMPNRTVFTLGGVSISSIIFANFRVCPNQCRRSVVGPHSAGMTTSAPEKLLRHRPYWRWSAGFQLGRLPSAMAPLAFTVLTTATTGSYRLGGIMMSVYVVAER